MKANFGHKLIGLLLVVVFSGCAGPDLEQARICRDIIAAVDREAQAPNILTVEQDPAYRNGVVVRYRIDPGTGAAASPRWIRCRFAGGGFSPDRGALIEVASDQRGILTDVDLFVLRRFWLGRFETQAAVRDARPQVAQHGSIAYGLQQGVNALVAGSVYGLLAVAYTLVFAIISRINMAFGEMAMLGAYAALVAVHATAGAIASIAFRGGVAASAMVACLAAIAVAALFSWAGGRLILQPLRKSPSQAVLIATVGLAIALQEAVRLSQGARDRWLQPIFSDPLVLAMGGGMAVTVTPAKIFIVATTVALFLALLLAIRRSRLGHAWRACADDVEMAALCGIDTARVAAVTFVVGGAYAGLAGAIIALHYGGVGFTMGTVLGFKALTAAVVGGIGSLPGAMIGGLLVATIETVWAAYLPAASRDLAVFTLLAVVLVFRPRGLFSLTGPFARRS